MINPNKAFSNGVKIGEVRGRNTLKGQISRVIRDNEDLFTRVIQETSSESLGYHNNHSIEDINKLLSIINYIHKL